MKTVDSAAMPTFHATTIVSVRRDGAVAVAGDGQVSLGTTVAKSDAVKVRRLDGKIEMDFDTARRLFTLICVLHIRG